MAVFQKASGVCTGRGFADTDANGWLAKLYSWITLAPASGGPGWTILLDKSTNPVSHTFTVDNTTDIFTFTSHGLYTGDILQVSNSGGGLPGGLSAATDYYVRKINANTFYLCTNLANAIAGTQINITTNGTGTNSFLEIGPYIVISNLSSPTINQVCQIWKLHKITSISGYVHGQQYLSFDTTNKVLNGVFAGAVVQTVDSGDFTYDFRVGDELSNFIAMIGSSVTYIGTDTFVGDSNLLEGTAVTGTLSGSMASSTIAPMTSGQESNFIVGNWYFIYDFSGLAMVNYVKVTNIDTSAHTLTLQDSSGLINLNYPAGAVIAAYAHRYVNISSTSANRLGYSYYMSGPTQHTMIPYCSGSSAAAVFTSPSVEITQAVAADVLTGSMSTLNPDDNGKYAVMRPIIREQYNNTSTLNTTGMNRQYGQFKNFYCWYNNSYAAMLNGKIINSKNYLFFVTADKVFNSVASNCCAAILDTTSLS